LTELKPIVIKTHLFLTAVVFLLLADVHSVAAQDRSFSDALVFFAGFDGQFDADTGSDPTFRTAETLKRETVRDGNHSQVVAVASDAGRFGDALRFTAVSKQVVLFDGSNLGYRDSDWSCTVAFWLKLDPDKDLDPGFCDPLQITNQAWNDSAVWVDFDKTLPRDFRMGVFPPLKRWNPENTPWDQVPDNRRPLVTVHHPPFSADRWTHVVMTFAGLNGENDAPAKSSLYLNGVRQGTLTRPTHIDWSDEQAAMMLGINYIGDLDELAVFQTALTEQQVRSLYELPQGIRSLLQESGK